MTQTIRDRNIGNLYRINILRILKQRPQLFLPSLLTLTKKKPLKILLLIISILREKLDQFLNSLRGIPNPHAILMSGNSDHSNAHLLKNLLLLKLLLKCPGNQIPSRPNSPSIITANRLLIDISLKAELNSNQHIRQSIFGIFQRTKQNGQAVGGRIRKQLQIIRRVLIVRGDEKRPDFLKESL